MFCKHCGNKIDDDSQFCSFCGTKQSNINKPKFEDNGGHIQKEAKTVNVNLSFGRRNNLNPDPEESKSFTEPKFDISYSKETDATFLGIVLLVITLFLVIFQPFKFNDIDQYNQFRALALIIDLVLRILIIVHVVNIAKRQNRETFGWALFAFFLPSIALIVIGQQKKLYAKFEIDNSLSDEENSLLLTDKAQTFIDENKYNECIRFAEKAIQLDRNNRRASDLLTKARLKVPVHQISNKHTQTVYRETRNNQILKIVSKNYQTIGASVFIDDKEAPDGEYHYRNDNRVLTVRNGKIEKMTE